jgi:putative membrane-bound dehydrogenase-like protein
MSLVFPNKPLVALRTASACIITLCVLSLRSQVIQAAEIPDAIRNAKGLDSALNSLHAQTTNTKPLSPEEALKHFKLRPGYAIDLIAAEPTVRQPLNINFDARGRMFVTQYIQYPFPKGLKIVEYDRYIRAKFDKSPLPPPLGDKGADRITILEDTRGNGTFDKTTTFIDGLNIATSALPGKGGVWVMNPPYLLFYPVKPGEDTPSGDPVVHLSGFGLQDTHAVANSLTWGPDGWIYGAQGSTCTAKVKIEVPTDQQGTTDFLGQAIWRYHPDKHLFEIFAEGGGNTFGVEFDDKGRLFSGTNSGNLRGVHYVQGGYYVKSWGKHGPLTNPNAFGFFDHMPHTGNGQRLTHTFSVYGGALMPELTGKIIGPNPLQSRISVTRMEPLGSTFKTIEEEPLVTTDDGWFRPVDLKVGPDGAVYICDFYEARINHVDPRDTWDRSNGRIWRVRPTVWIPAQSQDLSKLSSTALVKHLTSANRLERSTALRLIGERRNLSVLPNLRDLFSNRDPQIALESLWALHWIGALNQTACGSALNNLDPHLRLWCIRLLAEKKEILPVPLFKKLLNLAKTEPNPEVRSQLASSAKCLPADQALPIIQAMLTHPGDESDPHIPLLLWWAAESKLATHHAALVAFFNDAMLWKSPIARTTIAPRLARGLAASAASSPDAQKSLLTLLNAAPTNAEKDILLAGINQAFEGRQIPPLLPDLSAFLAKSGNTDIAARSGDKAALATLIAAINDDNPNLKDRCIKTIELLGQVGPPEAAAPLLNVALTSQWHSVRRAAFAALTRFNDPAISQSIVATYAKLPTDQGVRPAAISTLLARKAWSIDLLKAIDTSAIPKTDIATEQLDRLRQLNDPAIAALLQKVFGQLTRPSSAQKEKEIARIKQVVTAAPGDAKAGREIFAARCAVCHMLFKEGGQIGPDLTPYERRNLDFLFISIIDPSAAIREEYTNFRIDTTDDQTFIGLIKERSPDSITLIDATQQKTIISKRDIKNEQALTLSIMPEQLLEGLTDQQLRDFTAYLQSEKPPK